MNLIILILAGVFSAISLYGQNQWQKAPVKIDPVVCFVSGESGHAYVRPPEGFINRLKSGKKTSNLIAQYVNVPDSVKPAFEYALDIWEYLLSSEIPVYIRINWEVLAKTNLGSCGATNYYQNFEGAPLKDTYYPIAAVEKITGKEISGSGNPDMIARFNLTIPWYTGTDGKTPSNKYDLVTIALHEITHGLGFNGFFRGYTNTKTASYGIGDEFPSAYDRFVEDYDGKKLTNPSDYANNSNDLYRAIISNHLYSGGPVTTGWNGDVRPRLYAPTSYYAGSSIYHLNDLTYPYGNVNSLMTSAAGTGEAIHSPGPFTSAMIADFGWKHLYIGFQPLKDREDQPDSIIFNAVIKSDLGIRDHSVLLVFSRDSFRNHRDTLFFKPIDTEGGFQASLKSVISSGEYTYYLTAGDSIGRKFTAPYNYPDSLYRFSLGPDQEKPVISHHPLKYVLSSQQHFDISATVTDNLGVDSVWVIFYRNDKEFIKSYLSKKEGDVYSAEINIQPFDPENNDLINYSIVATDRSKTRNTGKEPETGTFGFRLERIVAPVTEYANDFEIRQSDFVLSDFTVSKEAGFDDFALNTPHPYPSPDRDNDSLELTTVLRIPVILQPGGKMSFDEVVLVEPGEDGAVFGNSDFYDYVIAEGSKNGGKSWLPLVDGYDSGSNETWKTTYNRQITGNNSISAGTKSMFEKRVVDLSAKGHFKEGDTLLIRFRLYSDPYAHGWGWAIDHLNIQNLAVSVKSIPSPGSQFTIWPNPVNSALYLKNNLPHALRHLDAEIVDITGRILLKEQFQQIAPGNVITLNVDHLPSGMLFLLLKPDSGVNFTQKIIKPGRRE